MYWNQTISKSNCGFCTLSMSFYLHKTIFTKKKKKNQLTKYIKIKQNLFIGT